MGPPLMLDNLDKYRSNEQKGELFFLFFFFLSFPLLNFSTLNLTSSIKKKKRISNTVRYFFPVVLFPFVSYIFPLNLDALDKQRRNKQRRWAIFFSNILCIFFTLFKSSPRRLKVDGLKNGKKTKDQFSCLYVIILLLLRFHSLN